MEARDSFCFPKNTKNPYPSPIGKKFGFCCCGAPNNENPNLFSKEKGSDFLFPLRWDFLIYKPEVLYYNKVITQQEAPQNVPFDRNGIQPALG